MSFIIEEIETMNQEAIETAGNVSDALRESGAHLGTIKAVYETQAAKYKSLTVEFETANGSARIFEFGGTVKPEDAGDVKKIEKANTATKKVIATLARLVKAAGLKDIKAATQGAVPGVDAKGNSTTTFPKFAGKKVTIVTHKEIEPNQDGTKVYVKQVVDTFKLLDKDGKDGMGRDRKVAFAEEAKELVNIHWQHTENPLCIAKLQSEQEQLLGTAPAAQTPALNKMPEVDASAPAANTQAANTQADDDDI